MGLDELCRIRQCLYDVHNHVSGKMVVNRGLMLETLESSLEIVTHAILEEKHGNGSKR
jgi:hypothetical protein